MIVVDTCVILDVLMNDPTIAPKFGKGPHRGYQVESR